jgi:hypothetical protein
LFAEVLQEWLDECATELERLRQRVRNGDTAEGINTAVSRLERIFAEHREDGEGEDDDLGDPWETDQLDPNRGYLTGDPVVDKWEREFARTGKLPADV